MKGAKMKKQVNTSSAPAAIGPYSQGVIAGNLLFVSGQIPLNPSDGSLVSDSLESQANQVFQNLTKQAKATGLAMGELLAITGQFDTFEGGISTLDLVEKFGFNIRLTVTNMQAEHINKTMNDDPTHKKRVCMCTQTQFSLFFKQNKVEI